MKKTVFTLCIFFSLLMHSTVWSSENSGHKELSANHQWIAETLEDGYFINFKLPNLSNEPHEFSPVVELQVCRYHQNLRSITPKFAKENKSQNTQNAFTCNTELSFNKEFFTKAVKISEDYRFNSSLATLGSYAAGTGAIMLASSTIINTFILLRALIIKAAIPKAAIRSMFGETFALTIAATIHMGLDRLENSIFSENAEQFFLYVEEWQEDGEAKNVQVSGKVFYKDIVTIFATVESTFIPEDELRQNPEMLSEFIQKIIAVVPYPASTLK